MPTTHPRPYSPDELAAVRGIVQTYYAPDGPAPRLLATYDALADDVRLLRDEVADLRSAVCATIDGGGR